MEGVWETERGAPLLLFAWPDEAKRSNRFEIAVPKLASLILTHDLEGEIKGLNEFPNAHPPVAPLFWGFRVMVGTGLLMLASSWLGLLLLRRAGWRPEALPRMLLIGLAGMSVSGWLATLAGWYVTEIGRQPFLVYGLLRTADLASATPGSHIALTLTAYLLMYAGLLYAYFRVMRHLARTPLEKLLGVQA